MTNIEKRLRLVSIKQKIWMIEVLNLSGAFEEVTDKEIERLEETFAKIAEKLNVL